MTINTDLLETLEALRNECSGKPRPHMLIPLLERADRVIAAARNLTGETEMETTEAAQRLQDHMEQHHGVCLSASEWDAAILATEKRLPAADEGEGGEHD